MSQKKSYLYGYNKQQIRKKWSEKENELLMNLTKIFGFDKKGLRLISLAMIDSGFERSPKQCKDRYLFYLNRTNINNELTEEELRKLLELTQQFGNKWSLIALELGNRTSQSIKNKFYAHVKKILRRLLLCTYKTKDSSSRMNQIKEGTLSNIFCGHAIYEQQKYNIDHHELMVNKFKQLIIEHHNIQKNEVLDETTKKEVKLIYNYLIKHAKEQKKIQQRNRQFSTNEQSQNISSSEKNLLNTPQNDYSNQISSISSQIESEVDLDNYMRESQNSFSTQEEEIHDTRPFYMR